MIVRINVITKDIYLWKSKERDSLIWKEELKASIKEFTPFVAKYRAKIKPIESNPPLGLFTISLIVWVAISLVDWGKAFSKSYIKVSWNPVIGM